MEESCYQIFRLDRKLKQENCMNSAWLGEFLGTMILILLGDGVVAGVLLKKSKAEGSGWMVITAGWPFAVMAGAFVAIVWGSSDAHLNPAVTIGMAVRAGSFQEVLPYFVAEVLGAIAGATLVWVASMPNWKETARSDSRTGIENSGNLNRDLRARIPNLYQRLVSKTQQ